MNTPMLRIVFAYVMASVIAGCGGGGGSSPAPVTDFPLLAGYKTLVAASSSNNFAVSGTCSGTATSTTSAAVSGAFEGVAGYSKTSTQTLNLTNCTPASVAASGTVFYDANYTLLGSSLPGVEYTKFVTAPPPLPTTVKVGDTAIYGTLTVYTDSSKTAVLGQRSLSYAGRSGHIDHGTAEPDHEVFRHFKQSAFHATNPISHRFERYAFDRQHRHSVQHDKHDASIANQGLGR
jgi:hypothetical protein